MGTQQLTVHRAGGDLRAAPAPTVSGAAAVSAWAQAKRALRFALFVCAISYGAILLAAASADASDGGGIRSVAVRLRAHAAWVCEHVPVLSILTRKVAALLHAHQLNFLIFIASLIGTVAVLLCACA